jgi:hypothetical protein
MARRLAAAVFVTAAMAQPVTNRAQAPGGAIGLPSNTTSLEGTPTVRLDATRDAATRHKLDSAESEGQRLEIRLEGHQFVWSSRGDRPLTLTTSGDYTYLLSDQPGQYIRIRRLNDRFTYVEHLDMDGGSVTYWGELRIVVGKQRR